MIEPKKTVLTQLNNVFNNDFTQVLAKASRETTNNVLLSTCIGIIVGGMFY